MKKIFLFVIAAFVSVIIVACGGTQPVEPKPEEPGTGGSGDTTTTVETFERAIVLEQFTSQYCVGCPQGDEQLRDVVSRLEANGKKVVWIAHHTGYEEDTLSIPASDAYKVFFGKDGTYNPAAMIDRTNPEDVGFKWSDFGPYFASYDGYPIVLSSLYAMGDATDKFAAAPAICSCDVECSLNGRELTVNVSGKFGKVVEGAAINVFLLQDNFVMYQAAAEGVFTHMHALRHSLTPTWGDAIKLSADNKYTATYTYTIPETIAGTLNVPVPVVLEDLSIAAFVSTHTSDVNNSRILNGNKCKVVE